MYFTIVVITAILLLGISMTHLIAKKDVSPWAYFYIVVGWCLFALPSAYKLSFGG